MKTAWSTGLALAVALSANAQMVAAPPPAAVAVVPQGRYQVVQGQYVNSRGMLESGLVKFDSQTGLTWVLQPAPATNGAPADFRWVPVGN